MDWNHREYITPNTHTEGTIGPATWTTTINQPTVWEQYLGTTVGAIGGAGAAGNYIQPYIQPFRWQIRPGDEQLVYIDDNGDEWHVTVDGDGSLTAEKTDPDAGVSFDPPAEILEELDRLAGVIES